MGLAFQKSYLSPMRCTAVEVEDAWHNYLPKAEERMPTENEFIVKYAKQKLAESKFYIKLRGKLGFDKNTIEASNNEYSFCYGYVKGLMGDYNKYITTYSDTAISYGGYGSYGRYCY